MREIGQILGENVRALMQKRFGKINVTRLAQAPGMSVGVAGRIKDGGVVQTNKLADAAAALGVEPWQLLVPGLDPDSLPRLANDETGWPFDLVNQQRYLALSKRARDLAQGYLMRVIEDLEASEKKQGNGTTG